jgi:hypothetical protein
VALVDVKAAAFLVREEGLDMGSLGVEAHRFVEIRQIGDQIDWLLALLLLT